MGLTPELGRATGERNGNSLQYFCLGSSMDREALWATVQGLSQKSLHSQEKTKRKNIYFFEEIQIPIYLL